LAAAPSRGFRALDIGCGAGSTSLALATARPDAAIIASDLSPSLIEVARRRLADTSVEPVLGDAQEIAAREAPFDLFFSRHGVMFFADPVEAFQAFRHAANPGATLIFSCFEDWAANLWASELANAAAGRLTDPPGREPGGFAFADPDHVRLILDAAGWASATRLSFKFKYVAGTGAGAVEQALSLLCAVGPASMLLRDLDQPGHREAVRRMRDVIEHNFDGTRILFPAAACIWTARA
jgi:SAM-dependent methyltransferase